MRKFSYLCEILSMNMALSDQTLATFQTRVRQMVLRFQQMKKENEELYAMLDNSEKECQVLREKLDAVTKEFNSYKMAKIIEVSDGDLDSAKEKLAKLIRDVNRCITILTDQK